MCSWTHLCRVRCYTIRTKTSVVCNLIFICTHIKWTCVICFWEQTKKWILILLQALSKVKQKYLVCVKNFSCIQNFDIILRENFVTSCKICFFPLCFILIYSNNNLWCIINAINFLLWSSKHNVLSNKVFANTLRIFRCVWDGIKKNELQTVCSFFVKHLP